MLTNNHKVMLIISDELHFPLILARIIASYKSDLELYESDTYKQILKKHTVVSMFKEIAHFSNLKLATVRVCRLLTSPPPSLMYGEWCRSEDIFKLKLGSLYSFIAWSTVELGVNWLNSKGSQPAVFYEVTIATSPLKIDRSAKDSTILTQRWPTHETTRLFKIRVDVIPYFKLFLLRRLLPRLYDPSMTVKSEIENQAKVIIDKIHYKKEIWPLL